MKNSTGSKFALLSLAVIFFTVPGFSQVVNIPDPNFKAALLAIPGLDENRDHEIQVAEADDFYGAINVSGKNISDLTGIGAFGHVYSLDCSNNQLTSLDLSTNAGPDGFEVSCQNNQLTSLLVSTAITAIHCENNQLTTLDLRNAFFLFELTCQNNQLKDLRIGGISTVPFFDKLWCYNNQLTSLDLSFIAGSEVELKCDHNLLTSLNAGIVSYGIIDCSFNQIASLDLSLGTYFKQLNCSNNQLTSLNVKDAHNKTSTTAFDATHNPNLKCVQVDDPVYSETNWRNNVDAGVVFSTDCSFPAVVRIPDANFKAILVADSTINTNRDGEIQVSEAQVYAGIINVSGKNIGDLTGIEAFTSMKDLACSGNHLTALNLSKCDSLQTLQCGYNQITSLDLSKNHVLRVVGVGYNNLSFLSIKNGNNRNMSFDNLFTWGNNNLFCIEVDDVAYANANLGGYNSINPEASFSTDCSPDRIISVPDVNFKQVLVSNPNINTNGDREIQGGEAEVFTGSIVAPSRGITDLTGIEAFRQAKLLNVSNNQLSSINLSLNKDLKTLDVSSNALSKLDLSQLFGLVTLKCQNNQLTSFSLYYYGELTDASAQTLDTVWCQQNKISSFTLYPATNLRELRCNGNLIKDMSFVFDMPKLNVLDCSQNSFTFFDITGMQNIRDVNVSRNRLTSLTLNTTINALRADSCALTSLNIQNANAGPNGLSALYAKGNPDLKCIQVNDAAFAEANYRNNVDAGARFSTNCAAAPGTVFLLDANFKAALVSNASINTNGDSEIQTSEAAAYRGTINVSGKNISSLVGIEAFTGITNLTCSNNQLTALDVSNNTALTILNCDHNQLGSLSISANVNLTSLRCHVNAIKSLDVKSNTSLTSLWCSINSLDSLNIKNNTALTVLRCSFNNLKTLDVSINHSLSDLDCRKNALTSLNVQNGNNTNFTLFSATGNPGLSCIQVDDVAYAQANWTSVDASAFFSINCGGSTLDIVNIPDANFKTALLSNSSINKNRDSEIQKTEAQAFTGTIYVPSKNISDLTGIEAFTSLTGLVCNNNQLTQLNVSVNTQLTVLHCDYNQLSVLNVKNNTLLTDLRCHANGLDSLDVSANSKLQTLWCFQNQINSLKVNSNQELTSLRCAFNPLQTLDVSSNRLLNDLDCRKDQLTSLNAQNGNNANFILFAAYENFQLTCVQVDDVAWANANWVGRIDRSATFSTNCGGAAVTAMSLFPNPASSTIVISGDQPIDKITASDELSGQTVTLPFNNREADINHLQGQVYLITVYSGKTMSTFRVVKK